MDVQDQTEEVDDFFDSPGRAAEDATGTTDQGVGFGKKPPSLKIDRRQSKSSDHSSRSESYSDSESNSASKARNGKPRKADRHSRSASSRSSGSYSSDDTYSSRDSRSRSAKRHQAGGRSRSQSSSVTRSRSRTPSPGPIVEVEGKGYRESERRAIIESITVPSGSYSSSDDDDRKRPASSLPGPDAAPNQAWNSEADCSRRRDKPHTKRRPSDDRPPQKDRLSKQERRKKHSSVGSDSDMTDVSPIESPRCGKRNAERKGNKDDQEADKGRRLKVGDRGRTKRDGKDEAVDMNILLKAVSELEKQHRIQSNTRRVMFECGRGRPKDKNNYTFGDDDTKRIDRENQRLLHNLMRQMHSADRSRLVSTDGRAPRPSSAASALNRRRDHVRIEKENLALLKRIQSIKPSRGLARNEQLSAYNSTVLHGVPIATMQPSGTGRARHKGGKPGSSASSVAGSLARTRSLTSVQSTATASSSGTTTSKGLSNRSRSRPGSSKMTLRDRPPWDDRW